MEMCENILSQLSRHSLRNERKEICLTIPQNALNDEYEHHDNAYEIEAPHAAVNKSVDGEFDSHCDKSRNATRARRANQPNDDGGGVGF